MKFRNAIASKFEWKEIPNIGIGCSKRVSNDIKIYELNEHFAKINTVKFSANIYSDCSNQSISGQT